MAFETRLSGRLILQTWVRLVPGRGPAGHHEFHLRYSAPAWPEAGTTSVTRSEARLITRHDLTPVSYEVSTPAGPVRLTFPSRDRYDIRIPGQPGRKGSTAGMRILLPANSLPILALVLHRMGSWTGRLDLPFFSPESLQVVPYTLERRDREILTSFGERIRLDRNGWIVELRVPGQSLSLRRRALPWPRWRSPAPVPDSAPVRRRAVRGVEVDVGSGRRRTGGTLLLPPSGRRARAAALFLGGSGSYDRDGAAGSVRLGYGDLAERLARAGIAVLRYDKAMSDPTPHFEGLVAMARAGVATLRQHTALAGVPLFLIGHSEGGLVSLEVARGRRDLAGVVLLATAGRRLESVLLEQVQTQARQLGLGPDWLRQSQADIRELFHHARHSDRWTAGTVPPRLLLVRGLRKWYRALDQRDPADLIGGLRCPVLILQGRADLQVSVADARMLHQAASSAGVTAKLVLLAEHDHLLRRVPGRPRFSTYPDRRRRISPVVSGTLIRWILAAATRDAVHSR